jgi:hypothetical protein
MWDWLFGTWHIPTMLKLMILKPVMLKLTYSVLLHLSTLPQLVSQLFSSCSTLFFVFSVARRVRPGLQVLCALPRRVRRGLLRIPNNSWHQGKEDRLGRHSRKDWKRWGERRLDTWYILVPIWSATLGPFFLNLNGFINDRKNIVQI